METSFSFSVPNSDSEDHEDGQLLIIGRKRRRQAVAAAAEEEVHNVDARTAPSPTHQPLNPGGKKDQKEEEAKKATHSKGLVENWIQNAKECYERHKQFLKENRGYRNLDEDIRANNKEIALAAVYDNGRNLDYITSEELQNDKQVVLVACSQMGFALKYAPEQLQNDKDVVLVACSQDGRALKYASKQLQNDTEVVLKACSQDGNALSYASWEIQNNKQVVLEACSQWFWALDCASEELQNNKEVVLAACSKDGRALQFASDTLRADKDVVMAAAESKPESLKFALGGLNQDKDCLVKAGLWDKDYDEEKVGTSKKRLAAVVNIVAAANSLLANNNAADDIINNNNSTTINNGKSSQTPPATTTPTITTTPTQMKKEIVLSTKFSLAAKSSPHATQFTVALKKHPYIANGNFVVYSPNAFNKGTCDPNWTDKSWPCRGTFASCRKPSQLKTGIPQESECCWRYSYRHHLEEARQCGGFMIQVVDLDCIFEVTHTLGDGQAIETEMAQDVGIKLFRYFEPTLQLLQPQPQIQYQQFQTQASASASQSQCSSSDADANDLDDHGVDKLVSQIQNWYQGGCKDMTLCNVK